MGRVLDPRRMNRHMIRNGHARRDSAATSAATMPANADENSAKPAPGPMYASIVTIFLPAPGRVCIRGETHSILEAVSVTPSWTQSLGSGRGASAARVGGAADARYPSARSRACKPAAGSVGRFGRQHRLGWRRPPQAESSTLRQRWSLVIDVPLFKRVVVKVLSQFRTRRFNQLELAVTQRAKGTPTEPCRIHRLGIRLEIQVVRASAHQVPEADSIGRRSRHAKQVEDRSA